MGGSAGGTIAQAAELPPTVGAAPSTAPLEPLTPTPDMSNMGESQPPASVMTPTPDVAPTPAPPVMAATPEVATPMATPVATPLELPTPLSDSSQLLTQASTPNSMVGFGGGTPADSTPSSVPSTRSMAPYEMLTQQLFQSTGQNGRGGMK